MHTISSVLNTVKREDYAFKIDLQDAYFHELIYPGHRKYMYLHFAFENKVYQFRVLPFGLNTAPQVFTRLGHTSGSLYLHRQGIFLIPYLDDWLIHHPDLQVLLRHQSQLVNTLNMVGLKINKAKSELEQVQDIQFLGLRLRLGQGSASLPISKAREIIAHACRISSQTVLSYRAKCSCSWDHSNGPPVSSHWDNFTWGPYNDSFILGLTDRFAPPCQLDPLVLATLLRQWQDLSFLTSGIPIRPFQAEFTIFHRCLYPGLGRSHGGFPDFGCLDPFRTQAPINLLELKAVILALHHWVSVLQDHQVMITTDNTTVVAYMWRHIPKWVQCRHFLIIRKQCWSRNRLKNNFHHKF